MSPYNFCRLAVDKAKLCPTSNGRVPRVAAVVALGEVLVGWTARDLGGEVLQPDGSYRAFGVVPSKHAEEHLLDELSNLDLSQHTLYVTLEPCTQRKSAKRCACTDRILSLKLGTIYIGNSDPNPDVGALAWQRFHDAGVRVLDFPGELRNEARRDNAAFFSKFWATSACRGAASFDYTQNGGVRILGEKGRELVTRWTTCGNDEIYAVDHGNNVSIAKGCSNFSHIDDPGRWFEDQHYTKPVEKGQIVIFRNQHGYALVKIRYVRVGCRYHKRNAEISFEYELRYRP